MAIYPGGDGSANNPYVVDTYDSFVEAINGFPFPGGTKHIAFPETYGSAKVIDMRSRGWLPRISVNPPRASGYSSAAVSLYIHGNGWTILGISCMGNSWWGGEFESYQITIDDLILKNFYILNTSNDQIALFEHGTGGSVPLTFNRCKFSGVLDAMNNPTSFEKNAYETKPMVCNSCSFNLKLVNHGYNVAGICHHYSDDGSMDNLYNCILNIIDEHAALGYSERGNNYWDYMFHGKMFFCKIVGYIKRNPNHSTETGLYYFMLFKSPSCYNVIDFEIIDMYKKLYIEHSDGYMLGVYNSDKTTSGGVNMMQVRNTSYLVPVTSAQMVDKDYLNSIDFICGDTPSTD